MILSADRRRSLTLKAQEYASELDMAVPYLLSRSISRQAAEMFGLGYVLTGEFSGRLSIPYHTPAGVVALKYRCTDATHGEHKDKEIHCAKYMSESGCGLHLWNAQTLIHADKCVVTEGELDALAIQAYVGIPAVAYPGTDTWKAQKHWRLCFDGVGEVMVVADGDDVGRKAARYVAESIGMNARVVDLPDGSDANLFLAEHGPGAFSEVLAR